MGNLLEGNNVLIKYRSISLSSIFNIPSIIFVCSHKRACLFTEMYRNLDALFRECHEMLQNVTECRCLIYGMQQRTVVDISRINVS